MWVQVPPSVLLQDKDLRRFAVSPFSLAQGKTPSNPHQFFSPRPHSPPFPVISPPTLPVPTRRKRNSQGHPWLLVIVAGFLPTRCLPLGDLFRSWASPRPSSHCRIDQDSRLANRSAACWRRLDPGPERKRHRRPLRRLYECNASSSSPGCSHRRWPLGPGRFRRPMPSSWPYPGSCGP